MTFEFDTNVTYTQKMNTRTGKGCQASDFVLYNLDKIRRKVILISLL